MLKFFKRGQVGKTLWYQQKGLVKRKTHMNDESPSNYHSKDMSNVKIYEKWVKRHGQGYEVNNYGTKIKVST
jgi:hypothetical protein